LSPGIAAFLVAASVSLWIPAYPNIHDDFANLLVADTLLHGRLANPTPPSHELLQTFHVVMEPSYAAKFPIGTGALLALGHLVFGALYTGMWISAALACTALTWMLLAELPKRWAWAFGMFAALHPMWQTGWSQEYTHGWLAIVAMALVLGGLLRMRRLGTDIRWTDPLAVACGLVIGIMSRPFEIAVLSAILGIWISIGLIRRGCLNNRAFWCGIAPASIVLALGFGFQGTINRSVTGSWFKLPYQLHEEQYGVAPVFVWQQPHEPALGHRFEEQIQFHRLCSMESYTTAASWPGYAKLMGGRVSQMMKHWGWVLILAPASIVVLPRERAKYGMVLVAALATLCAINGIPWVSHTYVAPLIPAAILLSAVALRTGLHALARQSSEDRSSRIQGRNRWQCMAILGLLTMQALGLVMATRSMIAASERDPNLWSVQRSQVAAELLPQGGDHLVMVRYSPGHDIHHEWVYNNAEPASSHIVWARWDESLVDRLVKDYPNRSAWIIEVAADDTYRLEPYPKKDPSVSPDGSGNTVQ
jgi:hypothetical protein